MRATFELLELSRLADEALRKAFPAKARTQTAYPPWVYPPDGHLPFIERNAVVLPGVGSSAVVLEFRVPLGMDGVIKRVSNLYLGGGFVSGSGDIIWRILADGRAVRNFANITSEYGSLSSPIDVDGIRIYSGQLIQYTVTHVANLALGDLTLCHLSGYYYPSSS